ncbi:MAG: GNAT family N-acetyltransferase [Actinomycetales bacterium]
MELPEVLPTIEGERVRLRGFASSDIGLVLEAASDPLIPLITTVPSTPDRSEALAYLERQHQRLRDEVGYSFAIARRETDEAVGQIGLWLRNLDQARASVGYWVVASARRQGYAGEALRLLSDWGLTLPGVERLELYVEPWNDGSWRAAERAGYRREGLLHSWQRVGDERRDMFMYSRLRH